MLLCCLTLLLLNAIIFAQGFSDEIYNPDTFSGTDGQLCVEYGFCSTCVQNGCNWCTLTRRCTNKLNICGQDNKYGIFDSLNECNVQYATYPGEHSNIRTTNYSPVIAESMSEYARKAYSSKSSSIFPTDKTYEVKVDEITLGACNIISEIFDVNYNAFEMIGVDSQWELDKRLLINALELLGIPNFDIFGFGGLYDLIEDVTGWIPQPIDLGYMQVRVGLDETTTPGRIIITFRGTTTDKGIGIWVGQVLRQCRVNWALNDIRSNINTLKENLNVKISEYFGNAYNTLKQKSSFFNDVKALINDPQYEDYEIFITGHSLGGALANIYSLDLYADYYPQLDPNKFVIYTFEQPRVGNDDFATLMNNIFNYQYYRVVHSNDIVVTIPPWFLGYRHNGIEIHYGEGDYFDGTLCQYRECVNLDPFEDMSCRRRYETIDYDDLIQNPFPSLGQLISRISDLSVSIGEALFEWEGIEEAFSDNDLVDMLEQHAEQLNDLVGDHEGKHYGALSSKGHCGFGESLTDNDVKKQTAISYPNTDNHRCFSFIHGNPVSFVETLELMNHLNPNGCNNDGVADSQCCLGKAGGPRKICKKTQSLAIGGFDLIEWCPANEMGDFCVLKEDCKGGFVPFGTIECKMGVCTDTGKQLHESCTPLFERCSSYANEGKLRCCHGSGTKGSANYHCEINDGLLKLCEASKLGESCLIGTDCDGWLPLGSIKCESNICKDTGRKENEDCFFETDCSTDGGYNSLGCCFGKCEKLESTGLFKCKPRELGQKCTIHTDCKGWGLGKTDVACCKKKWYSLTGTCQQKMVDWAGLGWCPHVCKKKWYSRAGTCGDFNYDNIGSCNDFNYAHIGCCKIETEWNLGIALGNSKYADTDSNIMFSYCIDSDCSDWYQLRLCDHKVFQQSCNYEFFIVDELTDDIINAQNNDIHQFHFEFINCGNDGIQIDQISIGHTGVFGVIDTFNNNEVCKWSGNEDRLFVIDGDLDSGNCGKVSLNWDDRNPTSSVISTTLQSTKTRTEVCKTSSACAGQDNECRLQKASLSPIAPIKPIESINTDFNDFNKPIYLYCIFGLSVLVLILFVFNIRQHYKSKYDTYKTVSVLSSDADCE